MCRDLLGQWIKLSLHLRGYSLEAEPVWFGLLCFRHGLQSCQGTSVHFPFPQLSWHLFETPIQINEFLLLPLSYNLIVCSWWSPHFKCDFLKLINCITGLWFSFCMAWTLWFFWPRNKKLTAVPEVLVQCITSKSQEDIFSPGQQILVGFDRYSQLCLQKWIMSCERNRIHALLRVWGIQLCSSRALSERRRL